MIGYKLKSWSCPFGGPLSIGRKDSAFKDYDKIFEEKELDELIKGTCFQKGGHVEYITEREVHDNGDISYFVDEVLDGTPFTIIQGIEIFEDDPSNISRYESNFWNMLADIYEHPENDFYLSTKDWDEKLGHSFMNEAELNRTSWALKHYSDDYPENVRLDTARLYRKIAKDKLTFKPIKPGTKASWIQAYFEKINIKDARL